jgi:hypothetical protein
MRRRRSYVFSAFHDSLEQRLSLGAIACGITGPTEMVATAMVHIDDPMPSPDPEPDPGPFPGDDPPIAYPPLPPSGPVGPGFHTMDTRTC